MEKRRYSKSYTVDWNKLHWYIKVQAYLTWMNLMKYLDEVVWLNYSTLFPIKRTGKMYGKTKVKLDRIYKWDPRYESLYIGVNMPTKSKKVEEK